jgi:hypothetical protein
MMIGNNSSIVAKRAQAQQVLRRRGVALGINENVGYGDIMRWTDHAGWHNPSGWENGTGDGLRPEHPDGMAMAGRLLQRRLDLA